jgi:molecular chaperone GrpE
MKNDQPEVPGSNDSKAAHDKLGEALSQMEQTVMSLKEELDTAQKKIEENHNTALRFRADLENFRRQAERDVANAHKYSIEKLAQALLPVLDSLEQGIAAIEKDGHVDDAKYHSLCEGMKMTSKLFSNALEKFNIEVIDPMGQAFDPHWHEALTAQPSAEAKSGTVLAVVQKGYRIHDRILRPARVIVAQ